MIHEEGRPTGDRTAKKTPGQSDFSAAHSTPERGRSSATMGRFWQVQRRLQEQREAAREAEHDAGADS